MKTIKQNGKWLLIAMIAISVVACSKKESKEVTEQIKKEELTKKIADIIPKQYQDTLVKLGIVINQEVNPPKLNGAFIFKTLRLVKSNRPTDVADMVFNNIEAKFFDQDNDNNIKYIARSLGATIATDTSIVTAISGSGKQFTVYGKTKSFIGSNSAVFGVIFSGEIDGNVLRNVRRGIINIDNSKGGTAFIKLGEGRVTRDDDLISESIPMF